MARLTTLALVCLALTASTAAAASVGSFSELSQTTMMPAPGGDAGFYLGSVVGPMSDGSILSIGGQSNYALAGAVYSNSVYRSTDNGVSWTKVTTSGSIFDRRRAHTASRLSDDSIVVIGGWDGLAYNADVWRSTDMGATWTRQTHSQTGGLPLISGHAAVVLADDKIVVMGGHQGTLTAGNSKKVWQSTNKGVTWTEVTVSGSQWAAGRFLRAAVLSNGHIVVANGENFEGDVWSSADDGATWTQLAGTGLSSTHMGVMLKLADDTLVYVGGDNTENAYISTDGGATWSTGGSVNSPGSYHAGASGVVVGSDILIIGGRYTSFAIIYQTNKIWKASASGLPSCHSSCGTCAGTGSGDCTSCASGSFLNAAGNAMSGTCNAHVVPSCSSTQYQIRAPDAWSDRVCGSCHSACATCWGPASSQCTSCTGATFLNGGSCDSYTSCGAPGLYEASAPSNTADRVCGSCDSSCYTCSGPAAADCLTCSGSSFLNAGAGTCDPHVVTCTSSQYEVSAPDNTADRVCASCDASCATCSGASATDCDSCTGATFLNTATGSCDAYSTCSSSEYEVSPPSNTADRVCAPCHASCASCSGAAANDCDSCSGTTFLNAGTGTCDAHSSCSSSQYESAAPTNTADRQCAPCDASCATCSGPGATDCDSCAAGKWLNGGQCDPCDGSCATCDAGTNTDCLSCTGATFLNAGAGSCDPHVVTCTSSEYEVSAPDNTADRVCAACDGSCAGCTGPASTDCASCVAGKFVNDNGECENGDCPTAVPNLHKVRHGGSDYLATTDCAATGFSCHAFTPRTTDDHGVTYYLVRAFPTDGSITTCGTA